jgi:phosphate transport system substrate-binding protein
MFFHPSGVTAVELQEQPADRPVGTPPPPPVSRTSVKRVILFVVLGGLLAAGVYASPMLLIKEEKRAPVTHLKTCGTSVVSVMVENSWRAQYLKAKNIQVDYESIGSNKGVEEMIQKKASIAFTHAPISEEQRKQAQGAGGDLVQVPILICAVSPIYNVKELKGKKPLNFTGEVLGKIFLGEIKTWNAPEIKAINADVELPPTPISVVHRQESSGTTLIFTDYLAKASPSWQAKHSKGVSEIKDWPTGEGVERNLNLAIHVSQKDGAIGYVDFLYTHFHELELGYGAIQDGAKTAFLRPDQATMTAAAQAALNPKIPEDLVLDVANRPGANAYPISGVIYAICYKDQPADSRALVADFLRWASREGQDSASKMSYAPLPKELTAAVDSRIGQIGAK